MRHDLPTMLFTFAIGIPGGIALCVLIGAILDGWARSQYTP